MIKKKIPEKKKSRRKKIILKTRNLKFKKKQFKTNAVDAIDIYVYIYEDVMCS